MSSRRDASSDGGEQGAVQPRYRRAFGCVTWVYMATLAFLAVASFGLMPVWFVLGWNVFSFLEGLAFFAIPLFLPAMFLGAALGLRTYRSTRREATRNGAAIGAIVGWAGFASLLWFESAANGAGTLYWLAVPAVLAAGALVLYALFAGGAQMRLRRRLVLGAALLVGVAGLALLAADFDPILVVVALVSTLAGAAGGWTAGVGYARAGGDEMFPPGAAARAK